MYFDYLHDLWIEFSRFEGLMGQTISVPSRPVPLNLENSSYKNIILKFLNMIFKST